MGGKAIRYAAAAAALAMLVLLFPAIKNRVLYACTARKMDAVRAALTKFESDCGRFPTTDEGLDSLSKDPGTAPGWDGPYLCPADGTLDCWGHPLTYQADDSGSFILNSCGNTSKIPHEPIVMMGGHGAQNATRHGSSPEERWTH